MPPNSALTRFIKQGLKRGISPLCRVAYKMDGEYMWALFDDCSSDDSTLDRLREARAFCAEHAERLRRLEVEGLRSKPGISNVHLDPLQGLEEVRDSLDLGEDLGEGEPCPACAHRDEEVEKNARYLLEEVEDNGASRALLMESNGLCFPQNIRKQGHECDGEPEGQEAESWRRAIYLTAGREKEVLRDEPPERPHEIPHYARVATRNKRSGSRKRRP